MPMWKTENVFCLIIPSITGNRKQYGGSGTDTSYTEARYLRKYDSEVNRWNFYNTLTDTSLLLQRTNCCFLSLQARSAYIRGNLFPVHGDKQSPGKTKCDSFSLSYNSDKLLGDDNAYSLYLHDQNQGGHDKRRGDGIIPCAFNIEDLVKRRKRIIR